MHPQASSGRTQVSAGIHLWYWLRACKSDVPAQISGVSFCSWHPMIAVGGRSGKNSKMCPAVTDLWWHVVLEIEADELITPYTVISISTGLFIAT